MINPSMDMRARQSLALTPRLQQSVKLLQLSSLEFVQEIRQALATNPFLEEEEATAEEATPEETPFPGDIISTVSSVTSEEAATPAATDTPPAEAESEGSFEQEEFSDYSEQSYSSGSRPEDEDNDFGSWVGATPSLREHLHEQLRTYRLSERDRALTELIVDSLDDDGFLREDIESLAEVIEDPLSENGKLDPAELRSALRLVQNLEPAGIAATSLCECLSLQLRAHHMDSPSSDLALAIVENHLDRLAKRDMNELRRRLDCAQEDLSAAFELIRSLNPRPAGRFGGGTADYIVPDVIVRKVKGKWTAFINPAVMPKARLNSVYANMFHRARCNDRAPMAQELQEARWLLRNARQRFTTILRVAEAIVTRQKTFFEYGEVALKPLVLRHVAEELGLHESTVSRATGNKFMATPRGIFEFKHFFSRKLDTQTGGQCSAAAIRALLKEMIAAEQPDNPLSDVVLTKMLSDQGVIVARRTVSKYRGMMKVPPAELRRQV